MISNQEKSARDGHAGWVHVVAIGAGRFHRQRSQNFFSGITRSLGKPPFDDFLPCLDSDVPLLLVRIPIDFGAVCM